MAAEQLAWRYATERLVPWPRSPYEEEGFRSALEDARRRHADDPDALDVALMRVYREHQMKPVAISCLPAYLRGLLTFAIEVPALWTPLKQGLPDKFARTVVIVERRPSPRPCLLARLL